MPVDVQSGASFLTAATTLIGNPDGDTARFFNALAELTINATGTIGSGVLFTGQTPPSGWDMPTDDGDWLYKNHPDAVRYCLIGALVAGDQFPAPDDWFFIGNGTTLVGQPSTEAPPAGVDPAGWAGPGREWKKLWLAVNRPAFEGEDPGGTAPGKCTSLCPSSRRPTCLTALTSGRVQTCAAPSC